MRVTVVWLLALVFVASWLLTGVLCRYAVARSLMDVPNERSSHSMPTPRGGGVAIVISFLACLLVLTYIGVLPKEGMFALAGAGAWVALVGFLDDHGHIAARWRLLAHFIGAGWALLWLGGLQPLLVFRTEIDLGWGGQLLAAVYLVWLLNLYNFMDGIDGLASIEAMTVCLGGVLLYWLCLPGLTDWIVPASLAAAVAGFLVWNFPPAKIFMGDAGSGFLGLVLGVMSIQAARLAPELLWGWLILLGVFVVDATATLFRRVQRGDKFYEAHRSHAYQYASRKFGAHKPVTLAVGAINVLWLLPLALLVGGGRLDGLIGVLIAYGPLVWLAFRFKAGARELQQI